MNLSTADHHCRYLAAFSTGTDLASPFGQSLKDHRVDLPRGFPLRVLVEKGWLIPVLRVVLPPKAFECWQDFPNLSMTGADACPEEHVWALNLYMQASASMPTGQSVVWTHFLDNPADPLCAEARAHSINPADPMLLPPSFRHARHNQQIWPWIDYFAYWQMFQAVEIVAALTRKICPLSIDAEVFAKNLPFKIQLVSQSIEAIDRKWKGRRATFDWLSKIRTIFGSHAADTAAWGAIPDAVKSVFDEAGLSTEMVKQGIRDTLLVMWSEWTKQWSPLQRDQDKLLELLRQDVQYAITAIEIVTDKHIDFLDPVWHYNGWFAGWAPLIEALPLEEELARRDFPLYAASYLKQVGQVLPAISTLDEVGIRALLNRHWQDSYPLRRFVLAFGRFHRELHGEKLMESEKLVRHNEKIEQFNLVLLHTERLLSQFCRERKKTSKYPEVIKLAVDSLNHVMGKLNVAAYAIREKAREQARKFIGEKSKLHEWDPASGLPVVSPGNIASGSDAADFLAASFVNFVIGRNYAAHHDAIDDDLVIPRESNGDTHSGRLVFSSAFVIVIAALLTRGKPPARTPG